MQVSSNVGAALLVSCTISGIASVLTYATIRSVPLANLNSTRLQLLIHHYRALAQQRAAPGVVALPRPSALCASDPVIVLPFLRQEGAFHPAIEVNTPLAELLHPALDTAAAQLCALVDTHRAARHLVMRDGRQRASKVHVVLHKKATPEDAIAAMLHAVLFRCVPPLSPLPLRGRKWLAWRAAASRARRRSGRTAVQGGGAATREGRVATGRGDGHAAGHAAGVAAAPRRAARVAAQGGLEHEQGVHRGASVPGHVVACAVGEEYESTSLQASMSMRACVMRAARSLRARRL